MNPKFMRYRDEPEIFDGGLVVNLTRPIFHQATAPVFTYFLEQQNDHFGFVIERGVSKLEDSYFDRWMPGADPIFRLRSKFTKVMLIEIQFGPMMIKVKSEVPKEIVQYYLDDETPDVRTKVLDQDAFIKLMGFPS